MNTIRLFVITIFLAGGSSNLFGSMEKPRPGMIREDQSTQKAKVRTVMSDPQMLALCRQYNMYTFVDHKDKPCGTGHLYSESNGTFKAQPVAYSMSKISDMNRNEGLLIDHEDGKRYGIVLRPSQNNLRAVVQFPHNEKIIVCERTFGIPAQQSQK